MISLIRFISLLIVSLIGTIISVAFFWNEYGFFKGSFFGFLAFLLLIGFSVFVGVKTGNSRNNITGVDLALPVLVSIASALLFFPIGLFIGNLFSVFTCIGSGILLSGSLFAYKEGHLHGAALVLPYMTFLYEILPIDFPTDIDNILCFGGSAVSLILGKMLSTATSSATPLKPSERIVGRSSSEDVRNPQNPDEILVHCGEMVSSAVAKKRAKFRPLAALKIETNELDIVDASDTLDTGDTST